MTFTPTVCYWYVVLTLCDFLNRRVEIVHGTEIGSRLLETVPVSKSRRLRGSATCARLLQWWHPEQRRLRRMFVPKIVLSPECWPPAWRGLVPETLRSAPWVCRAWVFFAAWRLHWHKDTTWMSREYPLFGLTSVAFNSGHQF